MYLGRKILLIIGFLFVLTFCCCCTVTSFLLFQDFTKSTWQNSADSKLSKFFKEHQRNKVDIRKDLAVNCFSNDCFSEYTNTEYLMDFSSYVKKEFGDDLLTTQLVLGRYRVQDSSMVEILAGKKSLIESKYKLFQDKNLHKAIWSYLRGFYSSEILDNISEVSFSSDGFVGYGFATVGFVDPCGKSMLVVDVADLLKNYLNDEGAYIYETLVHESAHILSFSKSSLNSITCDVYRINNYDDVKDDCDSYNVGILCFKKTSAINNFYEKFWTKYKAKSTKRLSFEQLKEFYNENGKDNEFISEYAVAEPQEDFAESFTAYVFKQKAYQDNDNVSLKVNFFDSYPEYKSLKQHYVSLFGLEN